MPHVEVALSFEVGVAHVSAFNILAYFLAILLNVTGEVILRLATLFTNVHDTRHTVCVVVELDFSVQDMVAHAHKCVLEDVLDVVEFNLGTILELHKFLPSHFEIDRIDPKTHGNLRIAIEAEHVVGAHVIDVRNGWMVTDLLHVDHAAVFEASLESLTEDWIQWLAPVM